VWNVSPGEFFLTRAENERDAERAADLFRVFLSWIPRGAPVSLAETAFDFLILRPDVARALGKWDRCKIQKWQKDQWKRRVKEIRKNAINLAQRVAYLTPRLASIREGGIEGALSWAAMVYRGDFSDVEKTDAPRERLARLSNDEIADAFIQGFFHYAENSTIPGKEAIVESWCAHSIPYTHTLLSLSVFLRHSSGMSVPKESLPHCIAAVVTGFDAGAKVPGYDGTLAAWIVHETWESPLVMQAVLSEVWSKSTGARHLPAFTTLSRDPGSRDFLVSLSCDALRQC
jgi:hypothetical protein